jgi:hypothetical protein
MPVVEGRHWYVATEYQYYGFLVWLINQLVKNGKDIDEALNMVVLDSKDLGHYLNSKDSTLGEDFETTGSRCVCGVYDLANTSKMLACSNYEVRGLWIAGGCYCDDSDHNPLAELNHETNVSGGIYGCVGMLVL